MRTIQVLSTAAIVILAALLNGCSLPKASFATNTGKVLKVYTTTDSSCRFVAYVVKRNGTEIVVSDTLGRTNHKVGDTITYMDQKMEMGSTTKALTFTIFDAPIAPSQETSP